MSSSTSSIPNWISYLSDPAIQKDMLVMIETGQVTENGLAKLFGDLASELAQNKSTLSASQFLDLKTIATYLNSTITSDYVVYITNALVNGNPANATYTGGESFSSPLGNLDVGATPDQIFDLNNKWFLGKDLPLNFYNTQNKDNPDIHNAQSINFSYIQTSDPLYGPSSAISFNDIVQGWIGDCYLLASLGDVAQQNPVAIKNMITDNGNGSYGVRFLVDGVAKYVTTSGNFAGDVTSINKGGPLFNNYYISGSTWVSLVENAYAQIQTGGNITGMNDKTDNSFTLIDFGMPRVSMSEITGATRISEFMSNKLTGDWSQATYNNFSKVIGSVDGISTPAVLAQISNALTARDDVALYSSTEVKGFKGLTTLAESHIMEIIAIDSANNNLVVRNPWGTRGNSTQHWATTFEISLSDLIPYGDGIVIDNAGTLFPASYTASAVNGWYQAVQFQSTSSANLNNTVSQLNNGVLAQSQVWDQIIKSSYTYNYVNPVIQAYQALFNRVPDQVGEKFWINALSTGLSVEKMYQNLANSSEFQNFYGASGNEVISVSTLNKMYQTMFGFAPGADGEKYWLGTGLPNYEALYYIGLSPQAQSYTSQAIYGYELTQIAGNNVPSYIPLYCFGGGPSQGTDKTVSVQKVASNDGSNAGDLTLASSLLGGSVNLTGQGNDAGSHFLQS